MYWIFVWNFFRMTGFTKCRDGTSCVHLDLFCNKDGRDRRYSCPDKGPRATRHLSWMPQILIEWSIYTNYFRTNSINLSVRRIHRNSGLFLPSSIWFLSYPLTPSFQEGESFIFYAYNSDVYLGKVLGFAGASYSYREIHVTLSTSTQINTVHCTVHLLI